MSVTDKERAKELAQEHAERAGRQLKHAASNVVDAAGYEKDHVTELIGFNFHTRSTPVAIASICLVGVISALAIRGGREVIKDLRTKTKPDEKVTYRRVNTEEKETP